MISTFEIKRFAQSYVQYFNHFATISCFMNFDKVARVHLGDVLLSQKSEGDGSTIPLGSMLTLKDLVSCFPQHCL